MDKNHKNRTCDWLAEGEAHDWLEHYYDQHHCHLLFVAFVSIAIKNLHRHLVAEEISIELVVGALHDYYCLALIHLRKSYQINLRLEQLKSYLLQLLPRLHFDHFFENLELF